MGDSGKFHSIYLMKKPACLSLRFFILQNRPMVYEPPARAMNLPLTHRNPPSFPFNPLHYSHKQKR